MRCDACGSCPTPAADDASVLSACASRSGSGNNRRGFGGRVEAVTHTHHLIAVVSTAVCWGAFVLTWVGGALYNASRGPRQRTRAPLPRLALVLVIACAIFFAIFRAVPTHTWRALELRSPWGTGIGLVIVLGSTVFTLWARFALGTMWTLDAVVKEGHALRIDGPYGITRHPIDTGILGMLLGSLFWRA